MTIVNGNAKIYLYITTVLLCFKRSKINTKMVQFCHLNGNYFLSVRRCGSYFWWLHTLHSAPFFSWFRTINSEPKLRFRTGARCGRWCRSPTSAHCPAH